MALMERLAIERVFSFDGHFSLYRFGPEHERYFIRLP
jgi:predicted nucleic acid-binding protein